MAKEVEKFLKDYKQIAKQVAELSVAAGEKQKKAMLAHLDLTWAAEDALQEAVQKSRLSGVQGKKAADFTKQPDVGKALKPWQVALKKHVDGIKAFEDFCDRAKLLLTDLTKRLALVEKELKKSGGTGDVKTMATIKEAQRALTDLKKSAGLVGSLQGHVVMYGANMQRALDGVVKNALAEVDPKEFPKAFEEDNLHRTERQLKDTTRKIDQLVKTGMKGVDDGKADKLDKLRKSLKSLLAELEALDAEGKKVVKTMKKELAAAANGKKIAQLIKAVGLAYKNASVKVEVLEDAIGEADEDD